MTGLKVKLAGEVVSQGKASRQKNKLEDSDKPQRRSKRAKAASAAANALKFVGEEDDPADADYLEDKSDDEYFRLGEQDEEFHDYSALALKQDNKNRPLWVCPDGRIFLETYSPVYKQAYDFLIAIAEPVCRPESVHEYVLTPHSLYAAVSIGLETTTIIAVLNRLSKVDLPQQIKDFIVESTQNYGKVKLVLQRSKFFVESPYPDILKQLLKDKVISHARVTEDAGAEPDAFTVSKGRHDAAVAHLSRVDSIDLTGEGEEDNEEAWAALREAEGGTAAHQEEDPDSEVVSFQIDPAQVEHVKARCLPGALNYPMLEEYDFKNDTANPDLAVDLKPEVQFRPYQERSMAKMFGNGRARSGIIVLPCGAGKSLTGIAAAVRIKKSILVLCTNSVSVDQWRYQFKLWTNLQDHQISRFTSDQKEQFTSVAGVCVTTYTMIAYSGRRSEESEKVMDEIRAREWGLLLLDEVHVVPAQMFRKVIGITKAHCKLGLTATLVREDDRISDLNFLIGPKLYEANWLDLSREGHIANVQCAEVWCPMTREFFREYLRPSNASRRQLLYVMNPNKFRACQFLIQFHEQERSDKIIVFSDNIFALRHYAMAMRRPFIYGATPHPERLKILHAFKTNPKINTIFLSKVGDNSIDIPEANVLIQISSHAGSRRQEAQRLGRILRAKKRGPGAQGSADEYNAFFYTLVSKDTQEMYFSTKRQQFLIDQGYSFKVITNLLDAAAGGSQLLMSSEAEQLDLLAAVLAAGEDEAVEEAEAPADDVAGGKRPVARRTTGSLAAMSGAAGMYLEYSTAAGGRGRQPAKPKKPKSALFRQAMRQ